MALDGVLAAREGLADFLFDLVVRVAEEDAAVGVGGGHFGLGTPEGGEEDGVDDGGLDEAEARGIVAALAEIGVLVDGAGDETGDFSDFFRVGAEDEGERGGEGGGGLHCREREFGDVVGVVEAEGAFDLVVGGALAHFADVGVEGGGEARVDELGVGENEGFLKVEANGDDVEGVLHGEAMGFFEGELGGVEEFFVVC